ncbi:DNA (cytosine-5-)-methyltransferase [Malacoplasma muris]|uniref:DNA (cytosine-5-)-methyltransferase n=1 Tax=Malacoplasma muris TaxID=2119 RepID=UPI00398EB8F1
MKNISKKKNWIIEHVGMSEWYMDAIIGYIAIHNSSFKPMNEKLNHFNISLDSKKLMNSNNKKMLKESIKYSYVNYSHSHFNNIFNINDLSFKNFPKNIDIFTYSFPCQDLSIQGLQKGIKKELNTRSGLLWEIERLFLEIKENFKVDELPKYLLMENVTNLLGKKNINYYNEWLNQLDKIGYASKTYVLNSKDFGSPQNRSRVFCLSIRKDFMKKINYTFKDIIPIENDSILKDVIDLDNKSNLIDLKNYKITNYTKTKNGVIHKKIENYTKFNSENYIYSINGKGPTLTASGANSRIKIEIDNFVRYMDAKESFLYMGFELDDYIKVKNTGLLSNNKIIFLAGNSIPVQLLEKIFDTLDF